MLTTRATKAIKSPEIIQEQQKRIKGRGTNTQSLHAYTQRRCDSEVGKTQTDTSEGGSRQCEACAHKLACLQRGAGDETVVGVDVQNNS